MPAVIKSPSDKKNINMEYPNHKIDEIFRQRLHDSEVPPPPFVWPAVEQELQKRRNRGVFLWLFAFGTVAAASVWLWQARTAQEAGWSANTTQAVENVATIQETDHSGVAEPMSENRAVTAAIKDTRTTTAKPENTGVPNYMVSKGKNTDRNTVRPGARTVSTEVSGITPVSYSTSNEYAGGQNFEKWQDPMPVSPDKAAPVAVDFSQENNSAFFQSDKALEIIESQKVVSLINTEKTYAPKTLKPVSKRKKGQPKLCYDFARHPNAWLLDVYAGPSLAQRTLTSRLDDRPYLNQRLASEHRDVAMNAGLRVSLMFNRNFLVRSGLHYDQVTENFEYIDPTSVIYTLKYTPGNPIPDTLGVEYGENYLKTYNRYAMLDVPLMVGMEMRKGRSGFSINAGLSANVLFQKRGVIIDPLTHEPARFGPEPKNIGPHVGLSQEVFRANVGLSATASIQWYWHLKTKFRVFVEPSFRQVLRPVSVSSHPVEHRYGIIGLRLGATKIF